MILRRPYAFLIKYFRIIHLIMFAFMAYLASCASKISSFFQEYISKSGIINVSSSEYMNIFIILSIFIVIAISLTIFFLMKYKNKPRTFYIIIIAISFISLLFFFFLTGNIRTLETSVFDSKRLNFLRDISFFHYLLLLVSSLPILIRGLGFNIKKFDFKRDIDELNLEAKDNEEVEVTFDLESTGVKRTGRKILRELKYYYIENKLFINIILSIVAVFLFIAFPFNIFVLQRPISEGSTLNTPNVSLRINESYVSSRSSIDSNHRYIILKVSVKTSIDKYKLDLNNLVLEGKKKNYFPTQKYYLYFKDLGVGYREKFLTKDTYNDYIIMYNIATSDQKKTYKIKTQLSDKSLSITPKEIA